MKQQNSDSTWQMNLDFDHPPYLDGLVDTLEIAEVLRLKTTRSKLTCSSFLLERMDVQFVLANLGITCYWQQLFEAGFETWETLKDITERDL